MASPQPQPISLMRGENEVFKSRAILQETIVGQVLVTNYQLIFTTASKSPSKARKSPNAQNGPPSTETFSKIHHPLGHIQRVDSMNHSELSSTLKTTMNDNNLSPATYCRTFRVVLWNRCKTFFLTLPPPHEIELERDHDTFRNALDIGSRPFLSESTQAFAFSYYSPKVKSENVYSLEREHQRLLSQASDIWRLTEINAEYAISEKLPEKFIIPMEAENDTQLLESVAKFRRNGFLPVLSWIHPKTQVALCRSGEPKISTPEQRNVSDEKYLEFILEANPQANKLIVFDARLKNHAENSFQKGGGFEKDYENVEINFLNVQTSNELRQSLRVLQEAFCVPGVLDSPKEFFKKVHTSQWMHHVRMVLYGVCKIIVEIESASDTCLVHCQDGIEKTPILTALAMIALDGYYRTILGLQALIEKEFLAFSYPFQDFLSHENESKTNPGFTLFLDCIFQFLKQFPAAFEYDERLLLEIAYHTNSNKYGTFLCNSHKERQERMVFKKTISLWTVVNQPSNFERYRASAYHKSKYHRQVLYPLTNLRNLQIFTLLHSNGSVGKELIDAKVASSRKVLADIEFLEKKVKFLKSSLTACQAK